LRKARHFAPLECKDEMPTRHTLAGSAILGDVYVPPAAIPLHVRSANASYDGVDARRIQRRLRQGLLGDVPEPATWPSHRGAEAELLQHAVAFLSLLGPSKLRDGDAQRRKPSPSHAAAGAAQPAPREEHALQGMLHCRLQVFLRRHARSARHRSKEQDRTRRLDGEALPT